MRLSDMLEEAAAVTRAKAQSWEGDHKTNLEVCADAFDGAAKDARDLERDAVGKKSPRFRGYHLRRRFRSGRARKEGAL